MNRKPLLDRELAYQKISDLVTKGKIGPGEAITERGLSEQLCLGRMPVREAIRELVRDGVLESHPARGTSVRSVSLQDLSDLFDLRHALESLATYRAAELGPTLELSSYGKQLRTALSPFDLEKVHKVGVDFHIEIFRAARNAILLDSYLPIKLRFRVVTAIPQSHDHAWIRKSADEHLGILEAIELRDPTLAQQRMQDHLTHSYQSKLLIYTRLSGAPALQIAPRRQADPAA